MSRVSSVNFTSSSRHIDDAIIVGGRFHPAIRIEFLKGLGDGRLVGDGDHPHPAPENAHLVDGIEALRAARDLHDGERAALRRADRADRKRNPVDLRLHDAAHGAVSLGADPDLALRPLRQVPQLPHLGVAGRGRIGQG